MNCRIKLAAIMENSRSEGPGERFVLWVQGCSIRCEGCCNPEMLDFDGGEWHDVDELLARALDSHAEGVTFLGGEPFDQAGPLGILAEKLRKNGLGVMTFTGYTPEQLANKPEAVLLLKNTDLLKAGPFIKEMKSSRRRWIGSDNQNLCFMTDRYKGHPDIAESYSQSVTISFEEDEVIMSGWPDFFGNSDKYGRRKV